ncbi:MAG TPA: hypothetical protein VNE61_06685 [Ktedonobacteraceae bacterium]|nr:hypothetical protein [Ktedonobacteraceae bacterium]
MLEIQLRIDQFPFASEIARVFPDLHMTFRTDYSTEYQATLCDGREGLAQLRFLHKHGIGYIDLEARRERLVREFFTNAEIEGRPIKTIHFQRVPEQPNIHVAALITTRQVVSLNFLEHWNPPNADVAHEYDEWICVYKESGSIRAALASRDGSKQDEALFLKTETLAEMEAWLQAQNYAPVLRLSPALGVFALYQPLRQTKLDSRR